MSPTPSVLRRLCYEGVRMRNRIARRLQGFLDLVTLASAYNLATGANYENLGNDKRLAVELPFMQMPCLHVVSGMSISRGLANVRCSPWSGILLPTAVG